MTKFLIKNLPFFADEMKWLEKMGEDGWELVCVTVFVSIDGATYYFRKFEN